jgi:hypothetical protein
MAVIIFGMFITSVYFVYDAILHGPDTTFMPLSIPATPGGDCPEGYELRMGECFLHGEGDNCGGIAGLIY